MILLLCLMAVTSLGLALLTTYFCLRFTKKIQQHWLYWFLNTSIFTVAVFSFILLTTYIVFDNVSGLFDKGSLNFALIFALFAFAFWIMKVCDQHTLKTKSRWFLNFGIFIGSLFILLFITFYFFGN